MPTLGTVLSTVKAALVIVTRGKIGVLQVEFQYTVGEIALIPDYLYTIHHRRYGPKSRRISIQYPTSDDTMQINELGMRISSV